MLPNISILVTTDNHLGHNQRNPVTSEDSFKAFEEALLVARHEKVDLVILAGDLFDKPDIDGDTLNHCMDIMIDTIGKKQTFGNVIDLENLSEYKIDRYAIPAIFINGNHDAPNTYFKNSHNHVLEKSGLFKWIGKINNFDDVVIEPVFVCKGNLVIAVYGIGYIKDKKLNEMLASNKLRFNPRSDVNVDHRILIVHQNTLKIEGQGIRNCYALDVNLLPDKLFDLIIWGHQHESCVTLKEVPNKSFRIYQPGSTIPTKIIQAEAKDKHAGILVFSKDRRCDLKTTPLLFQRPMIIEKINFDDLIRQNQFEGNGNRLTPDELIWAYVNRKYPIPETNINDLKPLVRFKLEIDRSVSLNPFILEEKIRSKVANPK